MQKSLNFIPEQANGRAASGSIQDGYYKLGTLSEGDGALPGKYKATIISKDIDRFAAEAKSKAVGTKILLPQYVAKAGKTAKNNVPPKYNTPETSKLTAEVKAQSNSIPFELTD